MSILKSKRIGITLGDPNGVGPEIVAKALAKPSVRRIAEFVVIGDEEIYRCGGGKSYPGVRFVDVKSMPAGKWTPGKMTPEAGVASWTYLQKSAELLTSGEIAAVVTAPVSKEAVCFVQPHFTGHTEFYADAFGVKRVEMMFVAGDLRVIILTRHIPLKDVPAQINALSVLTTITMADAALRKFYKMAKPRIAVCGLNPHAGEGGKLGKEEIDHIIPAIQRAQQEKIDARGPFPADTVFTPGVEKRFDIVIAMYHDQGLAPIKALCFDKLVNVTVGLPMIRTSPAHGTAFNIAGQNRADPASMVEAIRVAVDLARKI